MPRTTRWELEPHTRAKHLLLEGYLGAWLPVMAQARRKPERVVVLDGFAGPGVYKSGVRSDLPRVRQLLCPHAGQETQGDGRRQVPERRGPGDQRARVRSDAPPRRP